MGDPIANSEYSIDTFALTLSVTVELPDYNCTQNLQVTCHVYDRILENGAGMLYPVENGY